MKSITFSSANLQNTVDCLNLFTITLNGGHFSLASAVVKALLGLHHFPYKSEELGIRKTKMNLVNAGNFCTSLRVV